MDYHYRFEKEIKDIKSIFEEVIQFYEAYYGITYEVVNLDTYIIYYGNYEQDRIREIGKHSLGFNLSSLMTIINEIKEKSDVK